MQPYFMPYIGYFQLINVVDVFVIYDEIEYTKKGWINRNRFLKNGKDQLFTLPLKKDSDFLNINQRYLSENWKKEQYRMLNSFKEAYRKAPYFNETILLVNHCLESSSTNLFDFIYDALKKICHYLSIHTKLLTSSSLDFDNTLKSANKVLDICKSIKATDYINPIGGLELYDREFFQNEGLKLSFIKSKPLVYKQFGNEFIPFLSIIDVLMFNPLDEVKRMIEFEFEII